MDVLISPIALFYVYLPKGHVWQAKILLDQYYIHMTNLTRGKIFSIPKYTHINVCLGVFVSEARNSFRKFAVLS
jgi:hypothetical protein